MSQQASCTFVHRALLYRGDDEFVHRIMSFVSEGTESGEPVLISVPGRHLELLRSAAPRSTHHVHFLDMSELGRNPGRIMPAVEEFLNERSSRPARVVGEPIWPGRSSDEIAEATRHEALINLAFSQFLATALCPYDAESLPAGAISDAWRTHPEVISDGVLTTSSRFADARAMCRDDLWPLAPTPDRTETSTYGFDDLFALRTRVHDYGVLNGLADDRASDLVLAVNEVASNSIRYGGGGGVLRMWIDERQAVVCEVEDAGHITNPLEGRYAPGRDLGARGLWLVNQLCDLVEVRSDSDGTRVRVRISP